MTTGKLAFLFPGQGSQAVGMGRAICEGEPSARVVFDSVDDALGFSLSSLCFDGPEEDLKLTENTQPAILTTSVSVLRVLEERGQTPDCVAGHSLGEYSALVAAKAISFEDAVRLVRSRGRYMQEAVPVGVGAMAAILGLDVRDVESVCRDAAQGEVVAPANLNGGRQVVIAGHREAVERACTLAKERGARRALPLPVSAPFHCALMAPAAERLSRDLAKTTFADLDRPLYKNVDAAPTTSGVEARQALVLQVASPVRWEETILAMVDAGVRRFVEVGPGKVLSGLVKKISGDVETIAVGAPEDLEKLQESGVV